MIVETYQLSIMCAFHPEICSFFLKNFPFLFLFLYYPHFGTFTFHVVYLCSLDSLLANQKKSGQRREDSKIQAM